MKDATVICNRADLEATNGGVYYRTFRNKDGSLIRESATIQTKNMQITKEKITKL